jgi:D-alanyl-D-alanine carboxypeptidase (penicillin-binding protein 5/6)
MIFLLLCLLLVAPGAFGSEPDDAWDLEPGDYRAALLINARTGEVLYESNPHLQHPPASMVKMMLVLLVMERLEAGMLTLQDPVATSARASTFGGSQVYLKEGEVFPLGEMMKAMMIHSANDASVAVAEFLAGSVEACVALMNERALDLGMPDTVFRSVDGLPPRRGRQPDLSTAYDLSILARELTRYPQVLHWASTKTAPFRGGAFILTNTNKLIGRFPGADGLKTGYYRKAGYNLTATAARGELRMIAVVMGASSNRARAREAARLLNAGFHMYNQIQALKEGEPVASAVPVAGGMAEQVAVGPARDVFVHVRRGAESAVRSELAAPAVIEAPVVKGKSYGEIRVKYGDREVARVQAIAIDAIPEAPLYYRLLMKSFD